MLVRALGDYQQARVIHEDTLARRQRVLGEDHPLTLITVQSVVADLEAVGEHEQARTLTEDIVVRRWRLGNDPIPHLPIHRPIKFSGRFDEG